MSGEMGRSLLISIAIALVSVGVGFGIIRVLFNKISGSNSSLDQNEKAELGRDVAAYKKGRDVVGKVLGLISLALVAYVVYRIAGVIPGVLSALQAGRPNR
jgi:exosortase/archaeosortase